MQTVLNPLVNVCQTQLEASRRFAAAVFSGTEKMERLMFDAIHHGFNQQLTLVQAMTTARDPQSAASLLQSKLLSRSPDDTMNYQEEMMRVFTEMQNDISKSLRDYVEQLGTNASTAMPTPSETAQRQANDTLYNPVTSMFSVWETAFKEAAALAKKNMEGTRSVFEDVTNRTVENAAGFTSTVGAGMEKVTTAASAITGSAGTPEKSAITGSAGTPETSAVTGSGGTPEKSATTGSGGTPEKSATTGSGGTPEKSATTGSGGTPEKSALTGESEPASGERKGAPGGGRRK